MKYGNKYRYLSSGWQQVSAIQERLTVVRLTDTEPRAVILTATLFGTSVSSALPHNRRPRRHAICSHRLIQEDECGICLQGKAGSLESFLRNFICLTPSEKKANIFTTLTVLYSAVEARPHRVCAVGLRSHFHYYVPFVGRVCCAAFLKCFGISMATLVRYREKIRQRWLIDEST